MSGPRAHDVGDRASRKPLVLVVDDDNDMREMLHDFLTAYGFEVDRCGDGLTAMSRVVERTPDVIVLDGSIPGVDGPSLTRHIRSLSDGVRGVAIVLVSGHSDDEYARNAKASGCDAYMVKPVELDELLGLVRRLVVKRATVTRGR